MNKWKSAIVHATKIEELQPLMNKFEQAHNVTATQTHSTSYSTGGVLFWACMWYTE